MSRLGRLARRWRDRVGAGRGLPGVDVVASSTVFESSTALTGSVATVSLDGAAWRTWRFGDRAWQREAWRLYDLTGALRFIANWAGNSVSRCRLYVAEVDDDGDPGEEVVDDPEVSVLAAGPLGVGSAKAEALRLCGINLYIPGECYIVAESGGGLDGEDLWWVVTGRQIKRSGDVIEVRRPHTMGGGTMVYRDGVDLIQRCWTPHPADTTEPDSPTRSAIPDLREMEVLRKREFAELDSRLTGAGLLLLPDGLDLPRGEDDPIGTSGFQQYLQRIMSMSLRDRDTAEAMVPIAISGDGDLLEKVRHVTFWSELSDQILPLRKAAVEALAVDLDIPPEVMLGLGSTNHWSAWQISEDAVKTQIMPILARIASALTVGYLAPALEAIGRDPARYTYAFDPARLTTRPNRAEDASKAYDRLLLSGDSARTAGAWKPDDAPDPVERRRRLAEMLLEKAPQVALADPGIRQLLDLPTLQLPPVEGQPPPVEGQPPPVEGEQQGPPAEQGTEPERPAPPAAVSAVSRLAARRALALAGGRLVPHRDRDRWPGVPRHQLHSRYGPVPDRDRAAGLLTGAWQDVAESCHGLGVDSAMLVDELHRLVCTLLETGTAYDDRLVDDLLTSVPVSRRLVKAGCA